MQQLNIANITWNNNNDNVPLAKYLKWVKFVGMRDVCKMSTSIYEIK